MGELLLSPAQRRVARGEGNLAEARRLGQEGLALAESIGHGSAAEIRAWLQDLPPE